MAVVTFDGTFGGWKNAARGALARQWEPSEVEWQSVDAPQPWLALGTEEPDTPRPAAAQVPRVPAAFLELARTISCHRDPGRWSALYRVLWRLTHGEPHLLRVAVDPDVRQLEQYARVVRQEVHHMRAFVRFREVATPAGPWLVAWYEPRHPVAEANAGFFIERFASLRWSILTPDCCLHWDTERFWMTPGVSRDAAPTADAAEDLWRTYYRNIFNPARLNVTAMKGELAPHYWKNLPEAQEIPALIAAARPRTEGMIARSQPPVVVEAGSARAPLPARGTWEEVRAAAVGCRACPLWERATCTVFGEGPTTAQVMVVGEQPGDQEDRIGRPFVGPAGQLLNRALAAAGVERAELYVTNAVKHFKWTPRGRRRLHANPHDLEIAACRPWLQAEVQQVRPRLIVCLGATAARSVLGRSIRVLAERGTVQPSLFGIPALLTVHPSALLRIPDAGEAQYAFDHFVSDLKNIHLMGGGAAGADLRS